MATVTRNAPCPCGSGAKYKKCCLLKDEEARLAASPTPPRNRVIHHRGRPLLVSGGRELPPGVLDDAVDYYEQKDRGDGPAAQMVRFIEPLLDAADCDKARMDRAFTLGMAFWNLALCEGEQREEMLAGLLKTIARDEQDAIEFRALTIDMVERHRTMFPALHRARAQEGADRGRDRD